MLEIRNAKVYDLEESVIACRNAMRTQLPEYTKEEFEKSLERAIKLCDTKSNSGHQTFLSGIRVSFDLIYPNYITPELQRYHWVDIVTSNSKMHKLCQLVEADSFNKYVDQRAIDLTKEYVVKFNETPSYENRIKLLSNCPQGIELFMRVSTNYLQLKTIYAQRYNHRLIEDWGAMCDFIKSLPYAKEFKLYF